MDSIPLPQLLGLVALSTVLGTLVLAALGYAGGLRATTRLLPVLFATLFFLALTQLPFPDPSLLKMQCPLLGARPNWGPFYTAQQVFAEWREYLAHPDWIPLHLLSLGSGEIGIWRQRRTLGAFLFDTWTFSAVMNYLVCIPIGALLPSQGLRWRDAVVLGFSLSLLVELTQLTAAWGNYPCAYRKFDMDDLILNTLGVALGFTVARRWTRRM
jgi:hypothetical protein